jgi:nucleotide-binding universal stress UspA family protein
MTGQNVPLERPNPTASTDTSAAPPFERMLVPVDFSSASREAFVLAMRLAKRWGSAVVLFNAAGFDDNDDFLDHIGSAWGTSDVVRDAIEHLKDFAETVVPGSAKHVLIDAARDADPVKAVARACARHEPSVVILGMHRHRPRRWRRSRAERIVQAVSCPVVVVRGDAEVPADADS